MYSRGKANVEAGDKQKGENEHRNCTRRIIYGILEVGVGSQIYNPKETKMGSMTFQLKLLRKDKEMSREDNGS